MISLVSKLRRPGVGISEPSRIRGRFETGAGKLYTKACTSLQAPCVRGGAYANRPKLRGRQIAGRTHGRPMIRVPIRHDTRRGPYRPTREGPEICL